MIHLFKLSVMVIAKRKPAHPTYNQFPDWDYKKLARKNFGGRSMDDDEYCCLNSLSSTYMWQAARWPGPWDGMSHKAVSDDDWLDQERRNTIYAPRVLLTVLGTAQQGTLRPGQHTRKGKSWKHSRAYPNPENQANPGAVSWKLN
jgi:hypothetical protein